MLTNVAVEWQILVEVLVAMVLGGVIGFEREVANKPAGFRTHMLVAGSAALLVAMAFMLVDQSLNLLQAQVAPHFLFNTLANVQALVDAGSPRASAVLRSLTAYLRAAVPLLNESAATIERELHLVRPYLELMQMRLPDRFDYAIDVDDSALQVRCPPTTVLTLVENAVRHGIDPSEEGGRIDVGISRVGGRCVVRVTDTGAGLQESAHGLGSGLSTLRERLQLIFGDAAHLRLRPNNPHGTITEIEMPAQT